MNKYDGINKVDAVVAANTEIVRKEKKESGGFWKTFLMQSVAVSLIGCALFVCGLISGKTAKVQDAVKDAVCFDAWEYVTELADRK